MQRCKPFYFLFLLALLPSVFSHAQLLTTAGQPARLDIRAAGESAIRITLKPAGYAGDFPYHPALADKKYPQPFLSLTSVGAPVKRKAGKFVVEVRNQPLTIIVSNVNGQTIQALVMVGDSSIRFRNSSRPLL